MLVCTECGGEEIFWSRLADEYTCSSCGSGEHIAEWGDTMGGLDLAHHCTAKDGDWISDGHARSTWLPDSPVPIQGKDAIACTHCGYSPLSGLTDTQYGESIADSIAASRKEADIAVDGLTEAAYDALAKLNGID